MKKIMFWGDSPTIGTGFGNVLKFIINHLPKDRFKISVLGLYYDGQPHDLNCYIHAVKGSAEQHDKDHLISIIKKENPDIIFLLHDVWILDPILRFFKESKITKRRKVVAYVPVDAEDHDPVWYANVDLLDQLVMYNEFGKTVATKACPDINPIIIEHGVDSEVFYKKFNTRREAKVALFKAPELHDSFIILNAGRNQPRKRLDITMRAFAEFAKDKPDAFIYMHSGIKDAHIDTLRMANELGISDRLIMTSDKQGLPNVSLEDLNMLYNACEVGINTGLGEGFGLPNAEHAATGAIQIVPNHSALTDLYEDCGILVPANILFTLDAISTTAKMVAVEDVVKALNLVYHDRELYKKHSKLCYEKFNSEKYSWKYITQQWVELFKKL
jgi:glycosyltransferase involved in cell wall biosynthesis